jgi:hypothetical protein
VLPQDCHPLFVASQNVAQNITQNEKCIPDPKTWGCISGCNFQSTVVKWFKAAKDETERLEREPKRHRGDVVAAGGALKKTTKSKEPPLILLPRSDTAVLNMRNGFEFFENGVLVSEHDDLSSFPPKEFHVTYDAILS